jgi:hypothetical protein
VAVQLVASVELQFSVAEPPTGMLAGEAVSVTVGGGTTVTVTIWLAVPPVPVQLREKVVVTETAPVKAVPPVGLLPVQPPEAVQVVALVELQVRVEAPPLATLAGLAVNATVGAGTTVTVTD